MKFNDWVESAENGTSGDMVHDMLNDWCIERDALKAENTKLLDALGKIAYKDGVQYDVYEVATKALAEVTK